MRYPGGYCAPAAEHHMRLREVVRWYSTGGTETRDRLPGEGEPLEVLAGLIRVDGLTPTGSAAAGSILISGWGRIVVR